MNKRILMTRTAMCVALLSVCAWITIPFTVPFTLQTLGFFVCLGLLGGKYGTAAVCGYLLLGAIGLPVFSGFQGGFGVLMGATGGYLLGFAVAALAMWLIEYFLEKKRIMRVVSMLVGFTIYNLLGMFWYAWIYLEQRSLSGFASAFGTCVLPFLGPDILKMICSCMIVNRIQKSKI